MSTRTQIGIIKANIFYDSLLIHLVAEKISREQVRAYQLVNLP
jgi:hypothetical protein